MRGCKEFQRKHLGSYYYTGPRNFHDHMICWTNINESWMFLSCLPLYGSWIAIGTGSVLLNFVDVKFERFTDLIRFLHCQSLFLCGHPSTQWHSISVFWFLGNRCPLINARPRSMNKHRQPPWLDVVLYIHDVCDDTSIALWRHIINMHYSLYSRTFLRYPCLLAVSDRYRRGRCYCSR